MKTVIDLYAAIFNMISEEKIRSIRLIRQCFLVYYVSSICMFFNEQVVPLIVLQLRLALYVLRL
jgi:hypothetical protein